MDMLISVKNTKELAENSQLKNGDSGNKSRNGGSKILQYFLPVVITLGLIFATFFVCGIYPFGTNTIASYDLHAQIVTFAEHFYDVIGGKADIFYTHQALGGLDVFGAYTFALLSPTTWILFVCGKSNVIYAVNLLYAAKLALIALSAVFFLRKTFKTLSTAQIVCLSLLYVFSGFMATANTYINWLDMMIWFPLGAVAFRHLLSGGKIRWFSICFAGIVASCYALGSFTLVYAFVVFSVYLFVCVEKPTRKAAITKTALACFGGVVIALPLLLPALWSFTSSTRQSSLMDALIGRGALTNSVTKTTYMLCDVVFTAFSVAFIFVSDKRDKINRFLTVALIISFIPVIIDEVAVVFNFGFYMSYSYRIGMLYTFISFTATAKLIKDISSQKFVKANGWGITAYALDYLLVIAMLLFGATLAIYSANSWQTSTSSGVINGSSGWGPSFAHSTGAWATITIGGKEIKINAVFECLTILCVPVFFAVVMAKLKVIKFSLVTALIIPVVLMQVAFVGVGTTAGNLQTTENYKSIYELTNGLDEDLTYVRFKDASNKYHTNFTMIPHFSSYALFSSNADKNNFTAPIFFGYDYNGTNSLKSYKGTVFSDCVLGYKYYLSSYSVSEYQLEKVAETTINEKSKQYLYRNKYALPDCFGIETGTYNGNGSATEEYNSFFNMLGGSGNIAQSAAVEIKQGSASYENEKLTLKNATDSIKIEFSSMSSGTRILYHSFPDNAKMQYSYDEKNWYNLKSTHYLGGGDTYMYLKSSGEKYKGQSLTADFTCSVVKNDKTAISNLYDTATANKADLTYTKNGFRISYNGLKKYLFLNSCALEGYTITVNGKTVEPIENALHFLIIPVEEGKENTVNITYKGKYEKLCTLTAGISAAIIVMLYFGMKHYNVALLKCEKVISVAYVILFVAIVAYFLAFPILVSITNAFLFP